MNQPVSNSLERDLQLHVFVFSREGLSHRLVQGDGGRDATHHSLAYPTGLSGTPGPVSKAPRVYPQSSMRELVESGRYDTREDFSVVLQPFFSNIRLPVLAVRSLPSPMGSLGEEGEIQSRVAKHFRKSVNTMGKRQAALQMLVWSYSLLGHPSCVPTGS